MPINKKEIDDLRQLSDYERGYEHFYDCIMQWLTTDAECNAEYIFENSLRTIKIKLHELLLMGTYFLISVVKIILKL